MSQKIIIPLDRHHVAPRFDMATEVLIVTERRDGRSEEKLLVLPQASAEQLCQLIITERIHTVICGGIEEEYYQYLTWKRVRVIDAIIGSVQAVLERFRQDRLATGDIIADSV